MKKRTGSRGRSGAAKATPSREQVRKSTGPRVNVPRQSKRPVERTARKRSR